MTKRLVLTPLQRFVIVGFHGLHGRAGKPRQPDEFAVGPLHREVFSYTLNNVVIRDDFLRL